MAVTGKLFSNFPHLLLEDGLVGSILAQDIKVSLHNATWTPSQANNDYWDDCTNEISGAGYTAGGATLGTKTNTVATTITTFDAADTSWTTATITDARYAVIYYDSGTDGTSLLIGYIDFGGNVSCTAGTFTITWNASGIFTITVA